MGRTCCESLTSFLAMNVLERAVELEAAGRRIIHMELGQPDFPTPECVIEAGVKAMRDGHTGYTHSMGILPLREGIAAYYEREYGISVSPEQVVVTNGSSPGLMMLFSAICDAGDKVLMGDPTYACYENAVRFAGGRAVRIPAAEEEGFQLAPEAVRRAAKGALALLINSPSNPAGTIISRDTLQSLANAADDAGALLVSDEIYHGLVYEGEAVSALEVTDSAVVLDGFSKRYAMTGWRLGWLVVPFSLVPVLQAMQQNFFISPNSVSQWAGLAALTCAGDDMARMAAEYNRRRVYIVERLRAIGFGVRSHPVGAFYVLADARPFVGMAEGERPDSMALAFDILEKAGVGVTPGIDFGLCGEGYIRFSYASSMENIEEAMHRLERYRENL